MPVGEQMRVAPAISRDPIAGHSPALMQVAGLTKRYGNQHALAAVSFDVYPGEILGLIGPNGAGKTTLLEAVAGVLPADSGSVLWRGTPLPRARRSKTMFYLPDGVRPWHHQYVGRVLAFLAAVYRRPPADVAEIVGAIGLVPVLDKRVLELSKGYARRLMLALALLTSRPLLLMDEPFDGFDLRQTGEIMKVLRRLVAESRSSLVLAIHQLIDAERVCDRFVLLSDGHVRGAGTLADLRTSTALPTGSLEDIFLALT
jgi:ABC-2 type transport system ATP-binding protein